MFSVQDCEDEPSLCPEHIENLNSDSIIPTFFVSIKKNYLLEDKGRPIGPTNQRAQKKFSGSIHLIKQISVSSFKGILIFIRELSTLNIDLKTQSTNYKCKSPTAASPKGDFCEGIFAENTLIESFIKSYTDDYFKKCLSKPFIIEQYQKFSKDRDKYSSLKTYKKLLLDMPRLSKNYNKDLKKFADKKTLVLGFEGVLALISMQNFEDCDEQIEIKSGCIGIGQVYVKYRPYLFEFLDNMYKEFELVIFCKGSEICCKPILDSIESKKQYFSHRIYNDFVILENPTYCIKSYDHLFYESGRTSDNTIIIDACISNFCLNLSNGLPIQEFNSDYETQNPTELLELAGYLEFLNNQPNICDTIKSTISLATSICI